MAKGMEALAAANQALTAELRVTKGMVATTLAATHHLYTQNQALAQAGAGKINNLPDFQSYMAQFVGAIANPQ